MERFGKQVNEYTSKQDMKLVYSKHFYLVYPFSLRFSAALGIARTSSALLSLARKFPCKLVY